MSKYSLTMINRDDIRKIVKQIGTPGLVNMNQKTLRRKICYECKNISFEFQGHCLV